MRITLSDALARSCMPLDKLPFELPESIELVELIDMDLPAYPKHLRIIHLFLHLPRKWQREFLARFALEVTKDRDGKPRDTIVAIADYLVGLQGSIVDPENQTVIEAKAGAAWLAQSTDDAVKLAGKLLLAGFAQPHLALPSQHTEIAEAIARAVITEGNL